MSIKQTIGFFGDSFCEHLSNSHSIKHQYQTYIEKTVNYFNADLVNLGQSGGSIWDLWLLQLNPLLIKNAIPDICVFVWTDPFRLYHTRVRNMNMASVILVKPDNNFKIWNAAKEYYKYLLDEDQRILEYETALYYFDNIILPSLPPTTKIIHLWSFGYAKVTKNGLFDPEKVRYLYNWKNGFEIRPALMEVSLINSSVDLSMHFDHPNHIADDFRNQIVFEWIRDAIDNYKNTCVHHDLSKYK
mgnify:CR=1 FL=1